MSRMVDNLRPALLILVLPVFGLVLGAWALAEAKLQRVETAAALTGQAQALARTLGPPLAAAAAATRAIDELLARRLLDDAHLIDRLYTASALSSDGLAEIVEQNELDSAVVVDAVGHPILSAGQAIPSDVLVEVADLIEGEADEVILGAVNRSGVEHLTVASEIPGGGAVVLRIHATTGLTFAGHLGVKSLLINLLGTEGVAYLGFHEDPDGDRYEATWDGGPLPAPAEDRAALRKVRGRTVFEVEVPVTSPAGSRAVLRVGLDGEPLSRAALLAARRTALVGVVVVLFSLSVAGIALVVRRRGMERVEAARRIAEAEMARRRNERLAAAGALAAGLAHEVRSPLNAIVLAAQRIERKQPGESECGIFASTIRSEASRLETVLRQFLELARPVDNERRLADLYEIADEVRRFLKEEAAASGVTIERVRGAGRAEVDGNSIRRALINLVQNAMHASPRGGSVEIVLSEENGAVALRVRDRGTGIGDAEAESLFDPFVSTRTGGTGLGLALVKRVADEHEGSCTLANRDGGGAEAVLRLPKAKGES